MPLGPHLEPKVQVVAFRAHQALPVGRAQQCHYGPQPVSIYWFKDFKALTNTAGDRPAAGLRHLPVKTTFPDPRVPDQALFQYRLFYA